MHPQNLWYDMLHLEWCRCVIQEGSLGVGMSQGLLCLLGSLEPEGRDCDSYRGACVRKLKPQDGASAVFCGWNRTPEEALSCALEKNEVRLLLRISVLK